MQKGTGLKNSVGTGVPSGDPRPFKNSLGNLIIRRPVSPVIGGGEPRGAPKLTQGRRAKAKNSWKKEVRSGVSYFLGRKMNSAQLQATWAKGW